MSKWILEKGEDLFLKRLKETVPSEWVAEEWIDAAFSIRQRLANTDGLDESLAEHSELLNYISTIHGFVKSVLSEKLIVLEELIAQKKKDYRSQKTADDGSKPKERVTNDYVESVVVSDPEVVELKKQVSSLQGLFDYIDKMSWDSKTRFDSLIEMSENRRGGFYTSYKGRK